MLSIIIHHPKNFDHLDQLLSTVIQDSSKAAVEIIVAENTSAPSKDIIAKYCTQAFIRHIKISDPRLPQNKQITNNLKQKSRYNKQLLIDGQESHSPEAVSNAISRLVDSSDEFLRLGGSGKTVSNNKPDPADDDKPIPNVGDSLGKWYYYLGYAREQCGEYSKAADAYQQALKLEGPNPQWSRRLKNVQAKLSN